MAERFTVELDLQDEKTRRAFEEIMTSQEFDYFHVQPFGTSGQPDLVIVDMQRSYRDVLQRAALIRKNAPQAEIFVASMRLDPDDLLRLFREDIADFIELPLKDQEFKQALQRFVKRRDQVEQSNTGLGKVINLMGCKGGIGTTTIAVNLAISLKQRDPTQSVVLVDLDMQFGDVALFLDLNPTHSIIHVAQNKERLLHREFMQDVLTPHDSGIFILPAARADEDSYYLTADTVRDTIEVLSSMFDYIVLDSGHVIHEITSEMLHRLPSLYLVSTLHLPAMRNTERFLDYLASDPLQHDNIRIIINRHRSKYEEIGLHEYKKDNKNVFFTIPNDYRTVSNFLNRAQPIPNLSRWGKLTKSFKQLAAAVAEGR